MKADFLTTPEAYTRTPRESFDRAVYGCAIQRVTPEEIEAAHKDCNRAMWFLAGVVLTLALIGVLQ